MPGRPAARPPGGGAPVRLAVSFRVRRPKRPGPGPGTGPSGRTAGVEALGRPGEACAAVAVTVTVTVSSGPGPGGHPGQSVTVTVRVTRHWQAGRGPGNPDSDDRDTVTRTTGWEPGPWAGVTLAASLAA